MTDDTWIGAAVGLLALPSLYFVWAVMRKLVGIGFFLLYALVGIGLTYAGLWNYDVKGAEALPYSIVAGFAFASVCSAIRARIARIVGIVFVIAMVAIIGWRL